MDWIERIFGIAPDGGDGSIELAIVVAATVCAAAAVAFHPRGRGLLKRVAQRITAKREPS